MKSFQEWRNANLALFEKRKQGAQKIVVETDKDGPSKITSWHFKAKIPQYTLAIQSLKGNNALENSRSRFRALLGKLNHFEKLTQKEFQEIMGEMEVWGEVAIQIANPKNY